MARNEAGGIDFDRVGQLLVDVMKVKATMLELGINRSSHSCNDPSCHGRWQIAIEGRRNHVRMICDGSCGQQMME